MSVASNVTVDVSKFSGQDFCRLKIGKPGVRSKVKSMQKLQEHLDLLNAEDGQEVTARAVAGVIGEKATSTIGVTKRIFIAIPPSKVEGGVQQINDPYVRACRFLSATKSRLFGPYAKAQPSRIMDGLFILPSRLRDEYREEIATARAKLELEYLTAIEADYQQAIDRARETPVKQGGLGPLFDVRDYPPVEKFLSAFSLDGFWVKLAGAEGLEGEFKARAAAANEEIFTALRLQFADLIDHISDVLTPGADGKAKRFQESTVENIRAFCAVFQDRNVFNDTELQTVVEKAKSLVAGVKPEEIRKSAEVRDLAAVRFGELKEQLSSLVSTVPTRSFDDNE